MSYPVQVKVTLQQLNGQTCDNLYQILDYDDSTGSPQYIITDGDGTLGDCSMWQVDLGGGQYTWALYAQVSSGSQQGIYLFQRTQNADDPTGNFCISDNNQPNCTKGQAAVTQV